MKITVLPITQVKPAEINIRLHPQKQIAELMRSVKMFGQTRAIVVDENYSILAGNGLYTAMQQLGYEQVECYVMEGLSEKQKRKLMLADNRVYELGLMDMDVFDQILKEMDGDSDIPGWDEDLIKTLTSSVPEVDDMIGDYGVFGRDEIDSMNNRQRDDYASPPQTAHYEPVAQQPAPAAPTPAPYSPTPEPHNPQPMEEAAPVQRYVICPKCGEKICL